jgi:hypothetical protein
MQRKSKPKKMPLKLEIAVKANNVEAVKSIVNGKNFQQREWLNAVNGRGRTALLLAVKYKSSDVAKLLLNLPDTDVNVHTYLPLVQAMQRHHLSVVNLLLADARINVNSDSNYNMSPLDMAIQH